MLGRTESGRVSGVVDFVIVDGQRQKPSPYYLGKLKERDQKAVKRARKRVYGSAGEGGCHAGAAEGPRVHQAGPYEAADSSAGMRQAGAT